jgi:hypothetical protein
MSDEWEVDPSGCWVWNRSIDKDGYGRCGRGGHDGETLAHRWSYKAFKGVIPLGMTVDHICFNRACINPDHLQLLTAADNRRRNRAALSETCSNGHPYDAANTYYRPSGRRTCRACNLAAVLRYSERKRSA